MAKGKDDDFLKRLLSTFKVEAEEHLRALSAGLMKLEKDADPGTQAGVVETIFREAHSLKGAARAVTRKDIESICQSLEGVFSSLKLHEIEMSRDMLNVLFETVDYLEGLVSGGENGNPDSAEETAAAFAYRIDSLLTRGASDDRQPVLSDIGPQGATLQSMSTPTDVPLPIETVRVATSRLDSIFLRAEEMISAKLGAERLAADLQKLTFSLVSLVREWRKIQPDFQLLRSSARLRESPEGSTTEVSRVSRLLDFVEHSQSVLQSLEFEMRTITQYAVQERRSIGAMVDNLLDDTKKALMLPFSTLLEVFPRLVRELARDQGKEIDLILDGTEIEADRRILEEIKDPLVHLVRNCIDHGIEKEETRIRKNKPGRGTVAITISLKNGDKVEIAVSDDGAGIDVSKLRSAALKQGLIADGEAESLSDDEVFQFAFSSGLSTSPIVTDISGRGLGLAIVREKVELLGGTITFETGADIGTTFKITLPMVRATYRGLLLKTDDRLFVLPAGMVDRVLTAPKDEIKTVEGRETIRIGDETVAVVRLNRVLGLPVRRLQPETREKVQAVILASSGTRVGFLVDEVLHEQEILVKSLGPQLVRVKNIAGATVLASGEVVPILNVPDLIRSAIESRARSLDAGITGLEDRKERTGGKLSSKSILIVEDSITSRALLRNIVEGAGYHVTTAVDGVDGYTQLRSGEFDVVVSDVDMPRMSGFELTAKIRSDKKYSNIPVILVTALDRREDKERGIDVGANAYIVKSSFDQSNLLETIRRFI